MSIYENLDALFGIQHNSSINYNIEDDMIEPSEGENWSQSKVFRMAVSEGMKEYHHTKEGKQQRVRLAEQNRVDSERFAVCGNAGNSHSEETRKKIALGRQGNRRLSDQDKDYILTKYDQHIGIKTIAKQIGFSPTAVRNFIKKNR
jgi:hypothetical protein